MQNPHKLSKSVSQTLLLLTSVPLLAVSLGAIAGANPLSRTSTPPDSSAAAKLEQQLRLPELAQLPTSTAATPAASSQPFAVPSSLPSDTTVKVDGSSSMTTINEALKTRFQEQFPGTTVDLADGGTDEALEALQRGEVDVVAVGRPLTEAEKAAGLVEVPVSREKIAIIIGPNNPLNQSLTAEQFAQIFRGDITNWSQLGGPAGAIRFVDRPDFSDTRQALGNYEVFQTAPLETGANATQVDRDDTAAVVRELGNDGIGYAIASQVLNQPNVKVVALHDTLPDDPRYPFSQPRGYVYRGTPSPGVQAFLGFATSAPGQEVIQAAKEQEAAAVASPAAVESSPAVSPEAAVPSASPETVVVPAPTEAPAPAAEVQTYGRVPWWPWWLAIPLLGGLLWWLLRDRGGMVSGAPGALVAATRPTTSRLILTPRNCRDAYAFWEISDAHAAELQQQGGQKLMLRLYDVTDIDMERHPPHSVKQFDCNELEQDLHVPIAVDDRDYVAELGYVTPDGRWLKLAQSEHVRVPACKPTTSPPTARVSTTNQPVTTATAAATLLERDPLPRATTYLEDPDNRIVLVPRNAKEAYVYWEVDAERKAQLRHQGGEQLTLRIYDATNLDIDYQLAHGIQEYECGEYDQDRHVEIPVSDRDYVADLGYVTADGRWLRLARSVHAHVPAATATWR